MLFSRDYYVIRVDGDDVTYTDRYHPSWNFQQASTSIVLHLVARQEVTVDPYFTGTIWGSTGYMQTSFGATLLYGD